MSDFGVIITFSKSGEFIQEELDTITMALKEIIVEDDYPPNIVDGNFLVLRKWDTNSYASFITEYYLDENEEELRQWAIEEDIPEAEEIAQKLEQKISSDIQMVVSFEEW